METPDRFRTLVGALVWAALAAGVVFAVSRRNPEEARPAYPAGKIWTYLVSAPDRVEILFPPGTPAFRGDPACVRRGTGLVTAGQIRTVSREEKGTRIQIEFFDPPAEGLGPDSRFVAVPNPRTPAWVIDVLLPKSRKEELYGDLRTFALEHREEIFEAFWTPVEGFLRDAFRILQEDLPAILESREAEIEALVDRHKKETFEPEILPVLKEEVWPLLEKRSEPLLEDVGNDLVAKVPLFDLGQAQVKDWIPLWGSDNVREVLRDFLRREALPAMQEHTEEFLALSKDVMVEITKNPRCTEALKKSLKALSEDPAFAGILRGVFQDLVAPEGRIFSAMRRRLADPAFLDRLNRLMEALGPTLNRAANRILLDDGGKAINPDLARVLRTQILWKDAAWIWIEPGPGPAPEPGHVFSGEVYSWKKARALEAPGASD
jgi:hypothetical protein